MGKYQMYLKYVQIVNYKNLKNVRFEFNKGANTIIGENDAGKSNAMTAMRILLDSEYYYTTKRLKESDFSHTLGDWRGHWIIISAFFDEISEQDRESEICNQLNPEQENEDFLKSYIRCGTAGYGTITLYIRPIRSIRKKLYTAETSEEFDNIRSSIRLCDYEFVYKARSQADFTNESIYTSIVGNIMEHQYADPDNEDSLVIGGKINMLEVWPYISVSFIDALRDVSSEMRKPKNPLRRVFDTLQNQIEQEDIDSIKSKIHDLNVSLSSINQVARIGNSVNAKLQDIVGLIYSPNIAIESRIKEDISSIAKYLSLSPNDEDDIELLGLGHLNILFIALKLVEFEVNRTHELLNIMIVEEPEAHVHTHIQRTLFDNLGISEKYTQVIMTTHSTHISEVSNIGSINVLKMGRKNSIVMKPTSGLDDFGRIYLKLKDLSLSDCIERYLDAKRSVLLFSKGVILVEGDAEEILIPALAKKILGMSLDEIGIGLINVGSVSFEYIASLFGDTRIQRHCAIVTDFDAKVDGAEKSKDGAAKRGRTRKEKIEKLYSDNKWVNAFYANYTFEVDFAEIPENREFYKSLIDRHFVDQMTIKRYKSEIDSDLPQRYDAVIKLAEQMGKGWAAIVMSQIIEATAVIPDYIIRALAFASAEMISLEIKKKMMEYVTECYENHEPFLTKIRDSKTHREIEECEQLFIKKYQEDSLTKYFVFLKDYVE